MRRGARDACNGEIRLPPLAFRALRRRMALHTCGMPETTSSGLASLQSRLGYVFRDPSLLVRALSHRSFGPEHNERLEFLGDAALGLAVGAVLYARGVLDEGRLSYWRSSLVRAETLADVARDLRLGDHLLLGDSEALAGGSNRESILADAMEAVIGAAFLDGGFDAARVVVERTYAGRLIDIDPAACIKDAKTRLQEWLQGRGLSVPTYSILETSGHGHAQTFRVRCAASVGRADASGRNRRAAEQRAAAALLGALEQRESRRA